MDSKNIESVHLPEEIIEEILSRLPVKSLLRFRCVSKSWLSLTNNEQFIEAQHQNSTKNRAFSHHKVIFECGVFMEYYAYEVLNEASSIKPCRVHDTTNNQFLIGAFAVGCCNGLLCLWGLSLSLFLWNPTTMIIMELPKLKFLVQAKVGLGWDGRSGAYKVFASSTGHGGNVYSSKTNSWKTADHGCLSVYDLNGVFACGKIHWLLGDLKYIECFDLGSEEFGRIELPFPFTYTSGECYALAEIGGCLHLLFGHVDSHRQSYAVVWVMKEESRWLKHVTFPLVFKQRYHPIDPVFGGGPNGEIFLIIDENFLVYDGKDVIVYPENKNIKYFHQGYV